MIWGGAIYNNYLDDETGAKLYAGNVEYTKRDSWGLRWTCLVYTSRGDIKRVNGKGESMTFETKGKENNGATYGRRSDWQDLYL